MVSQARLRRSGFNPGVCVGGGAARATGSPRIEVTDTRVERLPPGLGAVRPARPLDDSGRGLTLVDALADRWEVQNRVPPGKTVLTEIDLPRWLSLVKHLSVQGTQR